MTTSWIVYVGGMSIIILLALIRAIRSSGLKDHSFDWRLLTFLLIWLFAGILPVLFLRNQAARYYASYSLVPFVVLTVYALSYIVPVSRVVYRDILLSALVIASFLSNLQYVNRLFAAGIHEVVTNDGRFHLIQKEETVKALHAALMKKYPLLPSGATRVLSGVGLKSIGNDLAQKFWYNDSSLQVISLVEYNAVTDSMSASVSHRTFFFLHIDSLSTEESF